MQTEDPSFTDVISDILSSLRLTGHLDDGLALKADTPCEIGAERHRISFYLVQSGTCTLTVGKDTKVELKEKDFVLVPHGRAHWLHVDPKHAEALILRGHCHFDEALDHPLIVHLPPVLVLSPRRPGFPPRLGASLDLFAIEAGMPEQGQDAVLARLIEVIFIQTVRLMATQNGRLAQGYMSAMADPHLFAALLAIHKRWNESWTISGLAREAGMSRPVFARRFGEQVGMPPIAYLTQWRLMKARRLLRETRLDMDEIAGRCGYASAPSLSRRFSSAFGIGPGAFRKNGAPDRTNVPHSAGQIREL